MRGDADDGVAGICLIFFRAAQLNDMDDACQQQSSVSLLVKLRSRKFPIMKSIKIRLVIKGKYSNCILKLSLIIIQA